MPKYKHYNELTPQQTELLAMLAEEAGEVIQVVGKILRHGYESYHPDAPTIPNRELLAKELIDFAAVVDMMDVDFFARSGCEIDEAITKKLIYAHHQPRTTPPQESTP